MQIRFLRDLKLRYKLGTVPFLFLAMALINFVIILNFKSAHLNDNVVVNVAGRQRMLSQKIAYLAERMSKGDLSIANNYFSTIELCDQSLKVLSEGGILPRISPNPIPPASEKVAKQLAAAQLLWAEYKENAIAIETNKASLNYIESNSALMLNTFNDLVQAFVKTNANKHQTLDYLLYGFLGFNLLLFVGVIFISNKAIARPIIRLTDQINGLALGNLSFSIQNESRDEVGQAIASLRNVTNSFKKISQFAQEISNGNLNAKYEKLSSQDEIGSSLIEMRNRITDIADEIDFAAYDFTENGDLAKRLETEGYQGSWLHLRISINNLFESISDPIGKIKAILESLAQGDLTQRYQGEAEGDIKDLTESLDFALAQLSLLLEQIDEVTKTIEQSSSDMLLTADEMGVGTGKIASATAEMSNGAQLQLKKVDETSSFAENVLANSLEMAKKSQSINDAAQLGVTNSAKGDELVKSVSKSIKEIVEIAGQTDNSMQELSTRSAEIKRVLSVIKEIASKTNLLALNAGIEAAQAGDAGRGFAVVAQEVRNLAEKSKKSAAEIEQIITAVVDDTAHAEEMIKEMTKKVEKGAIETTKVSTVFTEISESSNRTLSQSSDILDLSSEQSQKMKEIVGLIEDIVVVAEQTTNNTESVAASSSEVAAGMTTYGDKTKELKEIANDLSEKLSYFQLTS